MVEGGWLSGGWMDVMECGCGGGWVTPGGHGGGGAEGSAYWCRVGGWSQYEKQYRKKWEYQTN